MATKAGKKTSPGPANGVVDGQEVKRTLVAVRLPDPLIERVRKAAAQRIVDGRKPQQNQEIFEAALNLWLQREKHAG